MKIKSLDRRESWALIAILFCIVLLYFPIIKDATLMVDDWGQLASFEMKISSQFSQYFPLWSNRPLAPILLTIITRIFELNIYWYFIFNLIINLISVILISIIIKKRFDLLTAVVFFILAIQPIVCDSFTYSPINSSTPTVSILLWSIATFLQYEGALNSLKKRFIFPLLLTSSLLIYEITLPLFLLNVLISIKNYKKFINFENISILLALLITLTWQKIIAKYLFTEVYSRLNFAPIDRIPYILNKFIYIFVDAMYLCYNALQRITFLSIVLLIIYFIILNWIFKNNNYNKKSLEFNLKNFTLIFSLLFSCSFLYILSNSTPTIVGYDNRGLSSTWLVFSFLIACLSFLFDSFPRLKILILTLILFFVSNLFIARSEDFIMASKLRMQIISDLTEKTKALNLKSGDKWNFVANIDNLQGTLNHTTIFSVPWDLAPALTLYSGIKSNGAIIHEGNVVINNNNLLIDGWFKLPINETFLYKFDNIKNVGYLIKLDQNIASKEELFLKIKALH